MAEGLSQEKIRIAADLFNRAEGRADGDQVAAALDRGLNTLGDSIYARLHKDVERLVGTDSMLMPLSELKARAATAREIDCYTVAESAVAVEKARYIRESAAWYSQWLAALRFGDVAAGCLPAIDGYVRRSSDERRLALSNTLLKVMPESSRAPLVLFRLLPQAVYLVTALAFHDSRAAAEARQAQRIDLAAIGDCAACRGEVLPIGQQCPRCGNPLWKSELLLSGV